MKLQTRWEVHLCPTHRWTTETHNDRCAVRDEQGQLCGERFSHTISVMRVEEHQNALCDERARSLDANPPSPPSGDSIREKLLGELRETFFRQLEADGWSGDEEIPSTEIESALNSAIERTLEASVPACDQPNHLIQQKLTPLIAAIYEVGNIPDTDDVGAPQDIDGPALWRAVDALQREVASLSASSETGGAGGKAFVEDLSVGQAIATFKALTTYAETFPEPSLDAVREKLLDRINPDPAVYADLEARSRAFLASPQQPVPD
ncbi:MAG TPA: hypothetical protein VGO13_05775, partial [Solirubrobacterales bacterium]|nr:hypothetical protein [Solirubrobacterales bacterium]